MLLLHALSHTCPDTRTQELPVLTHAFFPYPAGMQPATAHHLLETVLTGRSVLGERHQNLTRANGEHISYPAQEAS